MTRGDDCPLGAKLAAEITALQDSDSDQWRDIDRIKNRLPNWATLVISLLTTAVGILATIVAT